MTVVPKAAHSFDASNDLLLLLQGLGLLEKAEDREAADKETRYRSRNVFVGRTETPYSLQVITAGTLALTQQTVKVTAALGGAGGVLASVAGFWRGVTAVERVTFMGAAAVVLATTLVAIALVVRADVAARSEVHAAEYAARGRVAAAFLRSAPVALLFCGATGQQALTSGTTSTGSPPPPPPSGI